MVAAAFAVGYFNRGYLFAIGAGLTLFASILEVAQIWIPGREARLIDIAAGAAGTWIALALIFLVLPLLREKLSLAEPTS